MELISQHTKKIMEGCKERARQAGLRFDPETLEYLVSNRDLIELSPKVMIPTLYDYWVHDVEVLKEKGRYELYPSNPYETVINTRPAISFYNDNNPDWLNVMIFYHVLAHIDFFQNNTFFRHTWDYDLAGQALADKRLFVRLRSEHGRWVDYIIEFARGIDNLVNYHDELYRLQQQGVDQHSARLDFYFDRFLQEHKQVRIGEYVKEIERYNECLRNFGPAVEECFFADMPNRYPEFETVFEKSRRGKGKAKEDLMQFLLEQSPFLNRDENKWMKSVVEVVRKTSLYFQPQIRTKFMNEGWASYWHEKLFLQDERIIGHEVDFARVHALVTALPRVGLNPYAIGMRLFQEIEAAAGQGHYSYAFLRLQDAAGRREFRRTGEDGLDYIFAVRKNLADFLFLNTFVNQDFVDHHNLFVAGRRLDRSRMVWQYYVRSRKAEEYRKMLIDNLYHPPRITVEQSKSGDGPLYLRHHFEDKPLVKEFIANTLLGIEYLWGAPVLLETTEVLAAAPAEEGETAAVEWRRRLYRMEQRRLSSQPL